MFNAITNGSAAFCIPALTINYTSGQAISATFRISNPRFDQGTQWFGSGVNANGKSFDVVWDQNGYNATTNWTTTRTKQQNIPNGPNLSYCGTVSSPIALTNSPLFLYD